jgi:hypothetical protein
MNDTPPAPPVYLDNPLAPDVFADGAMGFFVANGAVHITLISLRPSYDPKQNNAVNQVVVGRVVIPVPGAQGLAVGLYDFLKQHGYDPAQKPANPKDIQ